MFRQKYFLVTLIAIFMALYFWGHNTSLNNPLRSGLFTLGRIFLDLGAVVLLASIGAGIGRTALKRYDFAGISTPERVAIEGAIGLGIISLIALIMGLIGFFNWGMWLVLLALGVYCFRSTLAWLTDFRHIFSLSALTIWERFIRRFVAILLFAALLIALAPPFAWDGINYHLVIPQTYLAEGAIRQHLENHFFGFPQGMEMLNALLMLLTGAGRAPAVLHFYMGFLGLISIAGTVRRVASPKASYAALLILLSSFNLWQLFSWPYVDLALMTYTAIALVAITEWRKGNYESGRWLALAALAAGFAAGVKYTAFPLLLALYLFAVVRNPRHFIRVTLIFGGFVALVFVPWMIKGALLYQNPVYPYLFPSPNWDDVRAMNFSESGQGLLQGGLLYQAQIPLIPFAATIFGTDKVTPYRFTTGLFLLLMPFVLLLVWKQLPDEARKFARDIVPMSLVVLGFWMIVAALTGIGGQTRLMMVGAPMVAILGALAYHGIENWPRRPIDMLFILQASMLLSLFLGLFDYLQYFAETRVLEYQAGIMSEDNYLAQNVGITYGAMQAMEELPEGSTVQFLWEPKTFYCPAHLSCIGDLLFDVWARPIRLGTSPEALLEQWRSAGIDYFLLFDVPATETQLSEGFSKWLELHQFALEQNRLFPEVFLPAMQDVWTDERGYTLYTWRDE
jgi:hypothetical protein